MHGNPYSSSDATMGPLMRNIKDKVCRESELIALLDDENAMEVREIGREAEGRGWFQLIVNGKIVSLSLPVKTVYEKLWRREGREGPMVIMYRMRGLLGDATEPFVQNLQDDNGELLIF